ncbi:MAG: amidohydrolase family protein [Planctomycetota bacterium]
MHPRTPGSAVLLLLATCACHLRADETSVPQQPLRSNPPSVYALTGASVVLQADAPPEPAVIIIRNGTIATIGRDLPIPPDAREIPLHGRIIYPGFIDAYSEAELNTDRLAGTARYWNGQVTPQLSVADQPTLTDAATLRRQGFVARLVAPTDGVIRGQSALLSTGDGDAAANLLVPTVAQHLTLTVPRRMRSGYPGSPMGAVALARQAMLDAQWFRDARVALLADPTLPPIEHNHALAALQPVIDGSLPVIISTSDEQFSLRAERFAAEFGLSAILLGNGREYRRLSEIAALRRPVILPLSFPKPPAVASAEEARDVPLESLLHWDIAPENPARLHAAGVRLAFTTHQLSSPSEFLKALRKAVARGLPPAAALTALTSTPADLCNASARLGTLQPGRLASFVVTDGDLFRDATEIVETWVAGKRYEHQPAPARSVPGQFELQLAAAAQFPTRLYLDVRDSKGRLKGRISKNPIPQQSPPKTEEPPKPSEAAAPAPATTPAPPVALADAPLELKSISLTETRVDASFDGKAFGTEGLVRISFTLTETQPDPARPAGFGTAVWPDGTSVAVTAVRSTPPASVEVLPAPAPAATPASAPASPDATPTTPDNNSPGKSAPPTPASFAVNYPLGAFGRQALPQPAPLTAFIHATIWTCGPAGLLEDATLLIENGRIVAVGRDVAIPPTATVVDLRGMHLTPGIIDCHSHMATDGGVNEATQSITCEVRVGDFVDATDVTIYRQLAGGVTAANILHGSANCIGGQNQVIKLRWGATGEGLKFTEAPPGVKFALGENVTQANRPDGGGRFPASRMGVEQLFRDAFEAARDYSSRMQNWKTSRRGLPPRRDLELEALAEIVRQERWIHCHSYRQDEVLALLRILEEYNIQVGTLQHILEGYKVADELAKHGAMASAFSDWWAYKFEVQDATPWAGALMHQQGVVVSFNSDDGELARHLNQEAAKAVRYGGLPREEALKFVTLNPARQLRVDHLVGSLEAGKQADFVVWNGDPLSTLSRCEQTWIDGARWFHRGEDEQLRATARQQRNTLIQKILSSGEETLAPGEQERNSASEWPRQDEYCAHFRHQAALQQQREAAQLKEQQDALQRNASAP